MRKMGEDACGALAKAGSLEELNGIRVRFLGKKGELTQILRGMGGLSAQERPRIGQVANEVRSAVENELEARSATLKRLLREQKLRSEGIDVTLPGVPLLRGGKHPLSVVLEEIQEIKQKVEIEIEMFIHGAMCVSYSGRCLLSHYMTGRSANYGACAHPCRYRYALMEEKRPGQYYPIEEDQRGSYILNSRDLCLLEYVPRLMDISIDAFKVEGRMKSPLYVASVASVYRQAIDRYAGHREELSLTKGEATHTSLPNAARREELSPKKGETTHTSFTNATRREDFSPDELNRWTEELTKTATRPFTNGFIESAISPGTVPGLITVIIGCTPKYNLIMIIQGGVHLYAL